MEKLSVCLSENEICIVSLVIKVFLIEPSTCNNFGLLTKSFGVYGNS